MGGIFLQYFAAFSAAFAVFELGACLAWSNPSEKLILAGDFGFPVSNDEFSTMSSMVMIGACVVCIPTGFMIKTLGRRFTMLILIVPFYIGWALIFIGGQVAMICAGRFFLGLAGGAFCICAPIYNAEIAQTEIRGQLGTFFQLLITGGILYSYIVGAAQDLFVLNAACAVLPIVYFILMLFQPESPVYLMSKDREEDAVAAIKRLRSADYDISSEVAQMKSNKAKANESTEPLGKMLARPTNVKALAISITLMLIQQITGINAVIFYSTSIFEKADTGVNAQMSTIVLGVMNFLCTFISTAAIDKFGRKILLNISCFCMGISCLLLAFYYSKSSDDPASVESLGWLPVVSLCVFIVTFSIGLGPVPWLLLGELFADEVRDVAGSISGTTNWALGAIITKLFPMLTKSLGTGPVFLLFGIFCFVGAAFIIFILPETKGKTMNEIQELLGGK